MTATQKFIEDAIKGGWQEYKTGNNTIGYYTNTVALYKVLLDPLAWQAVGKTRGWEPYAPYDLTAGEQEYIGEWLERQHAFIDHLADGKTIEDALVAIS
jgi:hypothetical protein